MAKRIPNGDEDFRAWVINFHQACAENLDELGLTSAQIATLQATVQSYKEELLELRIERAKVLGMTATKESSKQRAKDEVSKLVKTIRSREVPIGLLIKIGVGGIDPRHPVRPQNIRRLTVRPSSNGTNWLQWDAGENKRGTQYVVEVKNANTPGFVYVTTTSKQSFKHLEQQPGFQQTYRVYALRNGQRGIPSFPFTVYGPGSGQAQLDLKVA